MSCFLKKHSRAIVFCCRLVLGCIFLASSIPKLRQPYDFLADVYKYELAGPTATHWIAMTVPVLEMTLGVCLLGGLALGGCFMVSGILSLAFLAAQSSVLARKLAISCGCFGSLTSSELIVTPR